MADDLCEPIDRVDCQVDLLDRRVLVHEADSRVVRLVVAQNQGLLGGLLVLVVVVILTVHQSVHLRGVLLATLRSLPMRRHIVSRFPLNGARLLVVRD